MSEDQPVVTPAGNRWIFSAGLAAFSLVMIMAGGVWDAMQTYKMALLIAGGACVAAGPIALLVRAPATPEALAEKPAAQAETGVSVFCRRGGHPAAPSVFSR